MNLGLYIHIPFCRSKCLYCDFCSFPRADGETLAAYVDALCRDLTARAEVCRDYTVDTVYFGGGTPTLLSSKMLCAILEVVYSHYRVAENAEITAECNPATGGKESFAVMRKSGFNRLSIGLQSAHANELRALGRLHTFADFARTFTQAREAGFENISADVMSGIPQQTVESYLQTLSQLCALRPEHISAYGLTVEEETPFGRMGERLVLPDEEATRQMYFGGIDFLAQNGYGQYEISNFARVGYESRHNLKYWNCEEYLGFGPAAYSDFCGKRFGNSRNLAAYIKGEEIVCESESPSQNDRMNEYVMLRMRLSEGIGAKAFETRFGRSFDDAFGKRLGKYENGGFVRRTDGGFAFTPEGMYVSNAILSEILDFDE